MKSGVYEHKTSLLEGNCPGEVIVEYDYFPGQKRIDYPNEKAQEPIPEDVIILEARDLQGQSIRFDPQSEAIIRTEILEWIAERKEDPRA